MFNIIMILLLLLYNIEGKGSQYECGAHGRFEYCIDGIPGCVIGCHCHPGYYFDTDTKICEPNVKLTQENRRALPEISTTNRPVHIQPTTQAKPADLKNNDDNLSDWLYNQFFKTIENQVINNTNFGALETRRSGADPVKNTNKKPTPIKKKKKKKAKRKKKGLRRFEEGNHDSVFHDTDSEDSSDGSETSDSDGTESESCEDEEEKPDENGNVNHKQFIMINKMPKPPLPSFIFLPNGDTPFYPPLSLQPPPPMQMYPMVPVPPVYPYIVPGYSGEKTTAAQETTTAATTTATDGTKSTTQATPPPDDGSTEKPNPNGDSSEKTTPNGDSSEKTTPNGDSSEKPTPNGDSSEKPPTEGGSSETHPPDEITTTKTLRLGHLPFMNVGPEARNRLMNQIARHRIRKLKKMPNFSNMDTPEKRSYKPLYSEEERFPLVPTKRFFENNLLDDIETTTTHQCEHAAALEQDRVNFKYLTDLIHRVGSSANQIPPSAHPLPGAHSIIHQLNQAHPGFNPFTPLPINGNHALYNNTTPKDDFYYTKLGREIASLIRRIDGKGEKLVNPETGQVAEKSSVFHSPLPPTYNDNTFGAKSYWERSVRSISNKIPRIYRRYPNNYDILHDLENQANSVVARTKILNLGELEDAIRLMEAAKDEELRRKRTKQSQYRIMSRPSHISYNEVPALRLRGNTPHKRVETTQPSNVTNINTTVQNKNDSKLIRPAKLSLLDYYEFNEKSFRPKTKPNRPSNNTKLSHNATNVSKKVSNKRLKPNLDNHTSNYVTTRNILKPRKIEYNRQIFKLPTHEINILKEKTGKIKHHKISNLSPYPFSITRRRNIYSPAKSLITYKSYFHQFEDDK